MSYTIKPNKPNVLQTATILIIVQCVIGFLAFSFFSGCNDKSKGEIVLNSQQVLGELLIKTKDATEEAYEQGLIDEKRYNQIKTNWFRAREVFGRASNLAIIIISEKDSPDRESRIESYFEMAQQIRLISFDILNWLEE
ncbi:MAG: hypothetical protein GWN01_07615 [Nitrosopumilaceae archaeon]|nr:hypothetical protein [Nitrosopumilaceae archaeon]NIU87239.1 hypothetical protein [Nitrosopumilaceae archaeon]NIV65769.1 hypothetical protein [Nitrosopumilaceae archaeon]NIX61390.1 hypothetical protein [Nitrosopumilaceae archaeon]